MRPQRVDSDKKDLGDLRKEILEEFLRDRVYAKLLTTLKAIGASKYREGVREQVAVGRFTPEQAQPFYVMAEDIVDTMVASLRNSEEERARKHRQEATERLNEQALMARVLFGADLSDETTARRKATLATSIVAIAVTKGGMLPREIPSFGVSLEPANQSALIWLGIVLTVYFTVGFIVDIYIDGQKATRGAQEQKCETPLPRGNLHRGSKALRRWRRSNEVLSRRGLYSETRSFAS